MFTNKHPGIFTLLCYFLWTKEGDMREAREIQGRPEDSEDTPKERKRAFVEPKLTFVEPELVKHGDLVHVTGFFGTFSP